MAKVQRGGKIPSDSTNVMRCSVPGGEGVAKSWPKERSEAGCRSALDKDGSRKKKQVAGEVRWGRNERILEGQEWAWKCLENLLGGALGHGHRQDELWGGSEETGQRRSFGGS